MDYIVRGGNRLDGEIAVYGAKNCALALLGASVLTDEQIVLHNCPVISDVENMLLLLRTMGKKVLRSGDTVVVSGGLNTTAAPKSVASLLRGSALILGGTVARYHCAELPLPGGCAIGARPMDIHLSGLEALGVTVEHTADAVYCTGVPKGAQFTLRFASVGATENLLCACALAEGESTLANCATEPEVAALELMLNEMGAEISGVGQSLLHIKGVARLHGADFTVIPDRIVAATYLSAAAATLGDVTVRDCVPTHLDAFLDVLGTRFNVKRYENTVRLRCDALPDGYGTVRTAPYPLFPTDMQSLLLSLAACSRGKTTVCETLFENRLEHNAEQLNKMGGNIVVKGNFATVYGRKLHGAEVSASDLRGGAGLTVAALCAEGVTKISGIEHVNRGYADLAGDFNSLGADIAVI